MFLIFFSFFSFINSERKKNFTSSSMNQGLNTLTVYSEALIKLEPYHCLLIYPQTFKSLNVDVFSTNGEKIHLNPGNFGVTFGNGTGFVNFSLRNPDDSPTVQTFLVRHNKKSDYYYLSTFELDSFILGKPPNGAFQSLENIDDHSVNIFHISAGVEMMASLGHYLTRDDQSVLIFNDKNIDYNKLASDDFQYGYFHYSNIYFKPVIPKSTMAFRVIFAPSYRNSNFRIPFPHCRYLLSSSDKMTIFKANHDIIYSGVDVKKMYEDWPTTKKKSKPIRDENRQPLIDDIHNDNDNQNKIQANDNYPNNQIYNNGKKYVIPVKVPKGKENLNPNFFNNNEKHINFKKDDEQINDTRYQNLPGIHRYKPKKKTVIEFDLLSFVVIGVFIVLVFISAGFLLGVFFSPIKNKIDKNRTNSENECLLHNEDRSPETKEVQKIMHGKIFEDQTLGSSKYT